MSPPTPLQTLLVLTLALSKISLATPTPQNPAEQGPDLSIGDYCPDKGVIWCSNANTKALCGQDNTVYQLLHCVQAEDGGSGCVSTEVSGAPGVWYPHCVYGVEVIEGPN
jgi:hypothetical protein